MSQGEIFEFWLKVMWNYRRVLSRARTGSGVNIRNIPLSLLGDGLDRVRPGRVSHVGKMRPGCGIERWDREDTFRKRAGAW